MRQDRETQIKNAITTARDLAAIQDQHRMASIPRTVRKDPALAGARRALGSAVRSLIPTAGAEFERFEQARAQYESALQKAAGQALADAVKQSFGDKDRLRAGLASRAKALDILVAADPTVPNPQRFLLNTPFLIWPTLGVFFDSSEVVPSNSSAKFKINSSRSNGYEAMSFYFLWENPSNKIAVINVDAYLVLHGQCQVGSGGGVLPGIISGDRYSQLWVAARLYLLEWWNQPPTQPFPQADTNQSALFLATDTGGWSSVGAIETASLFRGYDLRHTLMLVPPNGVVVFQVAAEISYSNADGAIAVDFASGGFEVVCPAVLVTVLS